MDQDLQRIAIANTCPNWTCHHGGKYCSITDGKIPTSLFGRLFDPLEDLNAQAAKYRLRLQANSDGPKAKFRTVEAAMCHATAAQRCEAFLRTIGKWQTTPPEPQNEQ